MDKLQGGHRRSHARSIRSGEGAERGSSRGDVGSLLKLAEGGMGGHLDPIFGHHVVGGGGPALLTRGVVGGWYRP
jgi:hypothetical protein